MLHTTLRRSHSDFSYYVPYSVTPFPNFLSNPTVLLSNVRPLPLPQARSTRLYLHLTSHISAPVRAVLTFFPCSSLGQCPILWPRTLELFFFRDQATSKGLYDAAFLRVFSFLPSRILPFLSPYDTLSATDYVL